MSLLLFLAIWVTVMGVLCTWVGRLLSRWDEQHDARGGRR